jgi:hypothetical protein
MLVGQRRVIVKSLRGIHHARARIISYFLSWLGSLSEPSILFSIYTRVRCIKILRFSATKSQLVCTKSQLVCFDTQIQNSVLRSAAMQCWPNTFARHTMVAQSRQPECQQCRGYIEQNKELKKAIMWMHPHWLRFSWISRHSIHRTAVVDPGVGMKLTSE